ncbi:uncharacterized protein LOC118179980, partial [Stegodyphus dumicola]|uniref:uncharacterized protein LOC118179980 n=1 Tax=Stegodyphus dumicola TaxID=202533 RepID=UPI0015AC7265
QGETCEEPLPKPLENIATPQCQHGLKCFEGKCVLDEGRFSCLLQRQYIESRKKEDIYASDISVPECDHQGFFKAKQQKKKKSICVDSLGKKLFGLEESALSENMTCGCSRHVDKLMKQNEAFMTKPQEHCTSDGNFDRLQCIDDLCYCANLNTGQVESRIVKITHLDKLPCGRDTNINKHYLRPCEKELQRSRKLRYQFHLKGIDVKELQSIRCDPDGTYYSKQCDTTNCVCTDRSGVGIGSYFIAVEQHETLKTEMTCNCARDIESLSSHSQYPSFNCKSYGNYILAQCFERNYCFCIDEEGEIISTVFSKTNEHETFCLNLLQGLTVKPGLSTTTIIDDSSMIDNYSDYD